GRAGALADVEGGQHFVIGRQPGVEIEQADIVTTDRSRAVLVGATGYRPRATIGEHGRRTVAAEVGAAQDVALRAGRVARLRIGRRAGLGMPRGILLQHETEFAGWFAVAAWVRVVVLGQWRQCS